MKSTSIPNVVFAALLALGCTVGPDYQRPAALGKNPMPSVFAEAKTGNPGKWKQASPAAHLPRGMWWKVFGEAELNRIEAQATADNQTLAGFLARFEQARTLVNVARADWFPQVSAVPDLNRQRTSANLPTGKSTTFNSYNVPLDASWELDLWGRVRREAEGARALATAAGDDLEAAKLTVQAEVAIDYFSLRSVDAQANLIRETIKTYQRFLELTQDRHSSGIATAYDVSLAETQLKSTEAQLPALELQRANLVHALAALCGQSANGFAIAPSHGIEESAAPAIPAGVPSGLLEQRPDIAAAERRMAVANAAIGQATAAFYPKVMLNGSAGYQSVHAADIFSWPSRAWAFGPSLQLPLFTGGRNSALLGSARAAYDSAVAAYRQTVLSAFQDVEDQLASQRLLAEQLNKEKAALMSSRRTLEISITRYKGGLITYLEVQNTTLTHEQTVVQLTALRQSAKVSLIKALGGGWSTGG